MSSAGLKPSAAITRGMSDNADHDGEQPVVPPQRGGRQRGPDSPAPRGQRAGVEAGLRRPRQETPLRSDDPGR